MLAVAAESSSADVIDLPLDAVEPGAHQPRKHFDQKKLEELAETIRDRGVRQPIKVRATNGRFEIVSGERRWRASRLAGRQTIPAIVCEVQPLVDSLVENLQRADLNTVEEALAVTRLVADIGVGEAARSLGKTPSWVSKRHRVGTAPTFVLECGSKDLEALYATALLAETDPERARQLVEAAPKKAELRGNARRASKGENQSLKAESARHPSVGAGHDHEYAEPEREHTGSAAIQEFFAGAINEASAVAGVGAKGLAAAERGGTCVVESVRVEGDALVFQTGRGPVELRMSLDVERELFELIRERLCT
jgi:ParB family transcriptional regulator, chromosome partitioning protein